MAASRKGQRSLHELGILHRAVATNQDLQDDRSRLRLGVGGIGDLRLFHEQGTLGELREC